MRVFLHTSRFTSIILLLSALIVSSATHADTEALAMHDEDWELNFDRNGIQIFTKDFPKSDFKAFKAEAVLNIPLSNLMAVMSNPGSCVEWVHGCIESWGFDGENFRKRYAYSINDLPWPVRDRDYVLEINTRHDASMGAIVMNMYAVTDKIPAKDELVRVTTQQTHYYFYPVGQEQTRMVWLQHTEPAGSIPSWLVNALIVDIPYKSMRKLEEVAQYDKYQNAVIEYSEEGEITNVTRR